jgi:hypothetical protein
MNAFNLTPTEEAVLKMVREGMSHREIQIALGWSGNANHTVGHITALASEKDRIRILRSQDRARPNAANTLGKARGEKRMISDVRRGKWK